MRQAWSRFCLINSLTGSCEGVKRELWLPVLIEGLQGTCACCPLLSASECKGLCQCELSYRGQVQSLLHIITLHIVSHSPSHSPSSPMFTCPFCALTSKGGEDLLFFFFFFLKYAQVSSYVALRFQQVLAGYVSWHLFSERENGKWICQQLCCPWSVENESGIQWRTLLSQFVYLSKHLE